MRGDALRGLLCPTAVSDAQRPGLLGLVGGHQGAVGLGQGRIEEQRPLEAAQRVPLVRGGPGAVVPGGRQGRPGGLGALGDGLLGLGAAGPGGLGGLGGLRAQGARLGDGVSGLLPALRALQPLAQGAGQGAAVGVTVVGVPGHRLRADRHQPVRDRRVIGGQAAAQRRRRAGAQRVEERHGAADVVGQRAAEELVQDRPQRVDVAARIGQRAAGLLRGHVGGRAGDRALHGRARLLGADRGDRCPGVVVADRPGEAPVHDVDLAEGAEHDVVRLEVPVDDAARVGVADRLGGLVEERDHPVEAQPRLLRPAVGRACGVEVHQRVAEGAALHDGHGVVGAAVLGGAALEDRHDARVLELSDGLRLGDEALALVGAGGQARVQLLERHLSPEHRVQHPGDVAHPAGTQGAAHGVAGAAAGRREQRQPGQQLDISGPVLRRRGAQRRAQRLQLRRGVLALGDEAAHQHAERVAIPRRAPPARPVLRGASRLRSALGRSRRRGRWHPQPEAPVGRHPGIRRSQLPIRPALAVQLCQDRGQLKQRSQRQPPGRPERRAVGCLQHDRRRGHLQHRLELTDARRQRADIGADQQLDVLSPLLIPGQQPPRRQRSLHHKTLPRSHPRRRRRGRHGQRHRLVLSGAAEGLLEQQPLGPAGRAAGEVRGDLRRGRRRQQQLSRWVVHAPRLPHSRTPAAPPGPSAGQRAGTRDPDLGSNGAMLTSLTVLLLGCALPEPPARSAPPEAPPAPAPPPEPEPVEAHTYRGTVLLVPLRSFPEDLLDAVEAGLRETLQLDVRRMPAQPLPQAAWYPPRKRYRAAKLLDHLHQFRSDVPDTTRVLGLTEVDISVTKDEHPDWGVFGYGEMPGNTAVISTYRLRGGLRDRDHLRWRVRIIGVHEIGHNLGLDHCTESRCFMQDAEGSIDNTDSASGEPGSGCEAIIERDHPRWF